MSTPTAQPAQSSPPRGPDIELKTKRRGRGPIIGALVVVLAVAAIFGIRALNAPKAFTSTLTVGTWSTDIASTALLNWIGTNVAPDYGIQIKTRPINDLVQINKAVDTGEIAGNWFEHRPFLNDAVTANGFKLTHAVQAFVWKQASYSKQYRSWNAVPTGAKIGLRADPAGQAIALLDLAWSKQITLKPGKDNLKALPQLRDIASNPKGYKFVTVPIGSLARTLDDVAVIVVHIADVYAAGLPNSQIIDRPPAPAGSEGGLVISTETSDDEYIEKLVAAFKDPKVDEYLKTTTDTKISDVLGPVPDRAASDAYGEN